MPPPEPDRDALTISNTRADPIRLAMQPRLGNPISLAAYFVALAAIAALMLRYELLAYSPPAVAVQVLAVVLIVWARATFGLDGFRLAASPSDRLVTTGPYRFWRHPIYAGTIFFVWAGVADFWSPRTAMLASALTLALVVRMLAEERYLLARHARYAGYAARTRRILPFLI